MWRVPFEEGPLMAVGKNREKESMVARVKTAGKPAPLLLEPDRGKLAAGGSDLSFITVTVTYRENNPVPLADNLVRFSIGGDATIAGVDNGSQTSHEPFQADTRRAFHGKCLLVVKAGKEKGTVTVTATSERLEPAECVLRIE